ncbi:hypothetical protein MJ575_02550 [Klebsiella pneumoniae]|nr:hypothetical protein MJ575_02550 [Klebsiella pneumoniae]
MNIRRCFSIAIAFIGIWVFSATDNSPEGMREREQFRASLSVHKRDPVSRRPGRVVPLPSPASFGKGFSPQL